MAAHLCMQHYNYSKSYRLDMEYAQSWASLIAVLEA